MNRDQNNLLTRRRVLSHAGLGLAGLGLSSLIGGRSLEAAVARGEITHPLAAKAPHFSAKAKRVIFFFMNGGMSHVDSFDPKAKLRELDGKESMRKGRKWKASQWKTVVDPVTGIETTELVPHLNGVMEEIALVRSLESPFGDHYEATLHMHTGQLGMTRPGIGAWLSYGLGTVNTDLPSHVVIAKNEIYGGAKAWDANFLPPIHQGTRIVPGGEPVKYVKAHPSTAKQQGKELAFLERLNEGHRAGREETEELAARMLSFDTAASLQRKAPGLLDVGAELEETRKMYGMASADARGFDWQCLMARRMAEHGVRFIEVIHPGNWDHHSNISAHGKLGQEIDRPIAGLIRDLRVRGMLEETLIVFATEFGRTPYEDSNPTGRGHHRSAFTCWLAGGGVKGGTVYGKSDETGNAVAENAVNVHDFHATILHLVGLDHERLTFRYTGRDFRLTDIHGEVITGILG